MELEAIHKALFRNLLAGGLFISILAGMFVALIELKSIDEQLSAISFTESGKISTYYEKFYNNRTSESFTELTGSIKNSLNHDLFIYIEFLDDRLQRVTQVSIQDYQAITSHLNEKFGVFKMTGEYEHKIDYYRGQLFIKIMVPVFSKKHRANIGHFQGIYHVADEKLKEIISRSLNSILLAVIAVLLTTVLIYPIILKLNKKLISLSYDLLISNTNILKSLGSAIAERDSDTNSHNYRVTIYSVRLAEAIGCRAPQIRALIKGAFLHDVGKIGIRDIILLKPGELTDEEFEVMKQHVAIGARIIKHNDWLKNATDVIQYHHEKFDGNGYLEGLKGNDIPDNAKIFVISDVFDALTSKRPYKNAYSFEKSMGIMKKKSGRHFDPEFFHIFEKIAKELYTEIHTIKNEEQLNNYLETIVNQYFVIRV